jgi:hypothetical protein
LVTDILKNPLNAQGSPTLSFNGFLADSFDITVRFGNKNQITIKNCYLISRGQTIQISEQVLLEEYGFLGRTLNYNNIN